jgi:hypothetical protein
MLNHLKLFIKTLNIFYSLLVLIKSMLISVRVNSAKGQGMGV